MPGISTFECSETDCEFAGPEGWGYYMYAVDDDGERVTCPHPGEDAAAREVVGHDASRQELDERTGFNYHCVCVDCAEQFDRDPERDALECPACNSRAVSLLTELVGSPCPDCGEGTVRRESTGWVA